jgi:hypothetical protein
MRLSLNFNPKKKILPIFYLTNSPKVLFYARTAYLCESFLGSQEIYIDVDHKGAPMSTHSEVDQHHEFRSENEEKHRVVVRDTFKADTLSTARLPKSTLTWNLHEASADNVCRGSKLKKYECLSTARHQPLGRVDSVSLCYLDAKILRQGNTHPELRGRDLRAKAIKIRIEPKQDSGVFEHLEATSETHVSTNT